MVATSVKQLQTVSDNVQPMVEAALEASGGLLRLAPTWVPRWFLHAGRRLKLKPDDLYAYGVERGGISERWFASTTEAANDNRLPDEGLSYIVHDNQRCTLRDAVAEMGAALVGEHIWAKHQRWPLYSKFFDLMGMIPLHIHQNDAQAALVGFEGKPEGYYFPPQHNQLLNRFPYTFFGLIPGTTKQQVRNCLENWHKGDNGVLELSVAYQLKLGTGWLTGPCLLHAPGSLCTYEPQWGSDVFGMFQNVIEDRVVPWSLLVKDVPPDRHQDLDYLVDQLDWETNVDPAFKDNHYIEPIPVADTARDGYLDRWIVYGMIKGEQRFTAKELTVDPGASCTITDSGAYGLITVQGRGRMNNLALSSPALIGFDEVTEDEVYCTDPAARAGVRFTNTSDSEPLVTLRYFGPDANPTAPAIGDHRSAL